MDSNSEGECAGVPEVDMTNETQIVVHDGAASDERSIEAARRTVNSEDQYTACVERILDDFRLQAQLLVGAQIKLHNQQTVNHDQVLTIFQEYAEAQRAIQQNTEYRLQAALADSSVQILAANQDFVRSINAELKQDLQAGLYLAIQEEISNALVLIEEAAKQRVLAAANELRPKLQEYVRELFESEKHDALVNVQDKLVQFVSKAEAHIHRVVTTALELSQSKQIEFKSSSGDEALQPVSLFKVTTERGLQQRIEDVVGSQRDSIIQATKDQLEIVLHQQTKAALADIQKLSVKNAKATATHEIEKSSKEIEKRLLEQMQSEIAVICSCQDSSSQQLVETTLVKAMKRLQTQIEKRINSVRDELLLVAGGAAQKYSAALATDMDARFQPMIADKIAVVKVETPAVLDAAWIKEIQKQIKIALTAERAPRDISSKESDTATANESSSAVASDQGNAVVAGDMSARIASFVADAVREYFTANKIAPASAGTGTGDGESERASQPTRDSALMTLAAKSTACDRSKTSESTKILETMFKVSQAQLDKTAVIQQDMFKFQEQAKLRENKKRRDDEVTLQEDVRRKLREIERAYANE